MDIYFGYLAGFLTTIAFVPQVIKVYKTNKTQDLSILTFSTFTLGVLCWLVYGLYLNSYPMIIANIVTFVLAMYIFIKILRNLIKSNK